MFECLNVELQHPIILKSSPKVLETLIECQKHPNKLSRNVKQLEMNHELNICWMWKYIPPKFQKCHHNQGILKKQLYFCFS